MGPTARSLRLVVVGLLTMLPAAAELSATATSQLERLRTGTIQEQTAAARWLGLNLVTEATGTLNQLTIDTPRDEAHEEFHRTAQLMLQLLWRPRMLQFRTLDDVRYGLRDDVPNVRASAVRHLAYYAPPDGIRLAATFLDDDDPFVREEAITALRELGDRTHAKQILPLLEEPEAAIRLRALEYLARLNRSDLIARLAPLVADPSPWIAQPAIRSLQGNGKGPATVKTVLKRLHSESDPAVLSRYLVALERLGPREKWPSDWSDDVRPLLTHDSGEVRRGAALLIGDGDPDVARDVLIGLLADPDGVQRAAAAEALAVGEWDIAESRMTPLLIDPEKDVRLAGVDLVGRLSPSRQRELLRSVLERSGEDPDVVSRALAGLAEVGTAYDVAFLVERVRGVESNHVRINTALTLAALERRWATTQARSWFRQQLSDPAVGPATRQAIVRGLQVVGDPSFLPILADELRSIVEPDDPYGSAIVQTMSVLVGRQVHGDDFSASGIQ